MKGEGGVGRRRGRGEEVQLLLLNPNSLETCGFRAMENEHLKAAFRVCVPEVLLPTRKDFSGDLLTTVSCEISEKILSVWRNTLGFACLISDGYTNISSEPVLNYLSVCEGISFLF